MEICQAFFCQPFGTPSGSWNVYAYPACTAKRQLEGTVLVSNKVDRSRTLIDERAVMRGRVITEGGDERVGCGKRVLFVGAPDSRMGSNGGNLEPSMATRSSGFTAAAFVSATMHFLCRSSPIRPHFSTFSHPRSSCHYATARFLRRPKGRGAASNAGGNTSRDLPKRDKTPSTSRAFDRVAPNQKMNFRTS